MSMSENPYEAPKVELRAVGVRSGRSADVRQVAVAQKAILICILIYLGVVILNICAGIAKFQVPPIVSGIVGLVILGVILVGAVFTFILAIRVHNVGLGILFGILALVPCVGFLVLLGINSKATGVLRANGYHVGLLGADLSKLPAS
jgi:hypothetical protein